jgi:hypothetical protein
MLEDAFELYHSSMMSALQYQLHFAFGPECLVCICQQQYTLHTVASRNLLSALHLS